MARNVLGKFQVKEFTSWKGLTRDNHLNTLFGPNIQKANDYMVKLLAYQHGPIFESLIASLPTREFETDDEYTWDVIGSSRRNIPLKEARDENGNVITQEDADNGKMIGAGVAPFYLVFEEDWSKWAA